MVSLVFFGNDFYNVELLDVVIELVVVDGVELIVSGSRFSISSLIIKELPPNPCLGEEKDSFTLL